MTYDTKYTVCPTNPLEDAWNNFGFEIVCRTNGMKSFDFKTATYTLPEHCYHRLSPGDSRSCALIFINPLGIIDHQCSYKMLLISIKILEPDEAFLRRKV